MTISQIDNGESGSSVRGKLNSVIDIANGSVSRGSLAMHATTMDLWAQPGVIDGTGTAATMTGVANAPQAGARRILYPVAASVITNGATFAVDGGANHTAAAGDSWEFEAVTTSTFKVHVVQANGKAVVETVFPIASSITEGDTTHAPDGASVFTALAGKRELLTADRTIYVGYEVGDCTISIASPAVITLANHGLTAGKQFALSIKPNTRGVSFTNANPGVIYWPEHGFSSHVSGAGQPVKFTSTGQMHPNIVDGTTYFVKTVSDADHFTISATSGGAAIDTTALGVTFTSGNTSIATGAVHNLKVGQVIQFAGTNVVNVANATDYYVLTIPDSTHITFNATGSGSAITPGTVTANGTLLTSLPTATFTNGDPQITLNVPQNVQVGQLISFSGTSVVNISNATNYYVTSVARASATTSKITISATAGGANITPGAVTTNGNILGTGIHFGSAAGATPTGAAEGAIFYVIADGLDSDHLEFSDTPGGAAINTSGTQPGGIITLITGDDANDGLAYDAAHALLTAQRGLDLGCSVDLGIYDLDIMLASRDYLEPLTFSGYVGAGVLSIKGDPLFMDNVSIKPADNSSCFTITRGVLSIQAMAIESSGSLSRGINLTNTGGINYSDIWFKGSNGYSMYNGGIGVTNGGNSRVSGSYSGMIVVNSSGYSSVGFSSTYALLGVPSLGTSLFVNTLSTAVTYLLSFMGGATGTRYALGTNGVLKSYGAGTSSTYFPGNADGTNADGTGVQS